jgi:hypothetical protein
MRSNYSHLASISLCLLCLAGMADATLVLNEIMFDPDGSESTDEFIELYNDSLFAADLGSWRVTDGVDTDAVIAIDQGLIAAPGQYVLILDPDYLDQGSTTYDGLVPQSALVVTINNLTFGSRGLSNSESETVSLIDPAGHVVSSYAYSIGNREGYSDERINPLGDDSPNNWRDAAAHNGTPGARNSVTPPTRDLAVTDLRADPPEPRAGSEFQLRAVVSNLGITAITDSLILYERLSGDVATDTMKLLDARRIVSLQPGDSFAFETTARLADTSPRRYSAKAVGTDDRPQNNWRTIELNGSSTPGTLIINEIMYAPEPQRCEWVELFNPSLVSQNVLGWAFGDGTGIADSVRRFIMPDISILSGQFLVLASDSSIFFERVPPSVPVLVWNSTPITLNNTGDSLALFDNQQRIIERVDYRPSWGTGVAGVSLERISAIAPVNDRLNWASSLDSTGATPGRTNSRAMPENTTETNLLTLEPNPFSPDGDGRDDVLAIGYRLDRADSRLDLKIYDVRGRQVRYLCNNEAAGYSGQKLWDGTDDHGRSLPTGVYIVYLEALGKGGTRIQVTHRVVALARRS